MSQEVLSVTQINEYVRSRMDSDPLLSSVVIRGEISNYKLYPSGHHYFTLQDENASLRCAIFKGAGLRLKFHPQNGMKVIAMGRISAFPKDSSYLLQCTNITTDGVGDLHTAFEQLKAKLAAQGLFAPAHKKPIPQYPGCIGVITSEAGAAFHDMIRVLRKRYPLTTVRLIPARVQGTEAPDEIAAAIRYANYYKLADVLIVGRGGGSIEDLWAFNDEKVAYAIYESQIPVISAVGHEPDVTISDYVADMRAATPSNAAELVVPDQYALRQSLDGMYGAMETVLKRQIIAARRHLRYLSESACLKSPEGYINQRRVTLKLLDSRLNAAAGHQLIGKKQRFIAMTAKLDAMSPLKVLSRGYSMSQLQDGTLLTSVCQVSSGDCVDVSLADGKLSAVITTVKENEG